MENNDRAAWAREYERRLLLKEGVLDEEDED